jgi:hypothetical protein
VGETLDDGTRHYCNQSDLLDKVRKCRVSENQEKLQNCSINEIEFISFKIFQANYLSGAHK